ncbi:hypothetical protein J6524_18455 [Bradyrhizobium sp. WSM 1738]|uniref:hypothetical protein n=1 Tax=Bradyrhizobium hereditatis TaxID=2821405 RepID=UPI001CE27C2C|nr:hypothetical protein [Bradyrhizobium hereditatis]MCA6116855.1 hypothetical protein [Bradyrhizobium hereditatis]
MLFAATMVRRQQEHHRAPRFRGIAMVDEESAGFVDEKLIEVGHHRLAQTKPSVHQEHDCTGTAQHMLKEKLSHLSTAAIQM